MKHRKSITAGLLGIAILAQAIPAMQCPASLTASAAVGVQSIQTRVFEYDFGDFKALYDIRTERWFDEKGKTLVTPDGSPQRIAVQKDILGQDITALLSDSANQQFSLEMKDGTVTYPAGILDEQTEADLNVMMKALAAIRPEYRKTYYDRAQQKDVAVPEPANFPLIYKWKPASVTDERIQLSCEIYFGTVRYGTATLKNGQTAFTRSSENESGSANPFTAAGDASVDGHLDISDAVLANRLLAEDENIPITALGTDLADKNEDGVLTGRDVMSILMDVAHIPAQTTASPAGTIPVTALEQIAFDPSDSETAKLFGFADMNALTAELEKDSEGAFRALTHCTPGGDESNYDIWDIIYCDKGGCKWQQFDVKAMQLDSDGILQIAADTYSGADSVQQVHLRLTVPRGELPKNLRTAWNLTEVRTAKEKLTQFPYIMREDTPVQTVPVMRLVQSSADEEEAAKSIGYKDAAALRDEIMKMNINTHQFQQCTEGEEYDTWNFVYLAEDGTSWQTDAVRSMTLNANGRLDFEIDRVTDSNLPDAKRTFIRTQVTVPHGALPLNRSTVRGKLSVSYQFHDYEAAVETKPAYFLGVSDLPADAIPVFHTQMYPVKTADMEETYQKYGIQLTQLEMIMGRSNETIPILKTESKEEFGYTYDHYSVLLAMDTAWGGYDQIELRSMELTADHKLHIDTEYIFDKYHFQFGSSDNHYLAEVTFSVPHGSLPEDLVIEWNNEKRARCQKFVLPEVQYISCEVQKPYQESDYTWADLRVDSDQTGAVIPAEMRKKLEAGTVRCRWHWKKDLDGNTVGTYLTEPDAAYEWRCYREPEETDDAAIKPLLAQGKDVIALYYVREDRDWNVNVEDALAARGVLKLDLEGVHLDNNENPEQTYYRILFVTPDGTLPEINRVDMSFDGEPEPESWLEEHRDAAFKQKLSARIELPRPAGMTAEVLVMDPFADGGSQPVVPEETVRELSGKPEGSYIVRRYTDPKETDNVQIRNLLQEGYGVTALYTLAPQTVFGISEVSLHKENQLDVTVVRKQAEQTSSVSGAWGILLLTEKDLLPKDTAVTVRDAGIIPDDDFSWENHQFPQIIDYREGFTPVEVRSEPVSEVPAYVLRDWGDPEEPFNEYDYNVWTKILTCVSQTDDPEIAKILADGKRAVIEFYIRDTRAAVQYGFISAEKSNAILETTLYGCVPADAEEKTCAAHRLLMIADKASLLDYEAANGRILSFLNAAEKQRFDAETGGSLYIPEVKAVCPASSAMQILKVTPVDPESYGSSQDYSVYFCENEIAKENIKKEFDIDADWSQKDVIQVVAEGEAEDRFAVTGVRVNDVGELNIDLATYQLYQPEDYYTNPAYADRRVKKQHFFLIVLDQGILPEIIDTQFIMIYYGQSGIYEDNTLIALGDDTEYEEAIRQEPVIVVQEQKKGIYVRGSEAGSLVQHTTDLLTDRSGNLLHDGEAVFTVLSAEDAQNADILNVADAAAQFTYHYSDKPDLNGADMLLVGFGMSGNVTECGWQRYGSYVDADGVLHLRAVVFRDSAQAELEDTNAACVFGIAADSGSFAEITGVVIDAISEYEDEPQDPNYAEYNGGGVYSCFGPYDDFLNDCFLYQHMIYYSNEADI